MAGGISMSLHGKPSWQAFMIIVMEHDVLDSSYETMGFRLD
jgi:hypothetical protein